MRITSFSWFLARTLLALVVGSASVAGSSAAQDSTLRILQLDVGQGDAALVITPENRRLLIDAGRSARDVADMLQQLGVDTVHLIVASHVHADHIGGMATILSSFPVRAYMDNGIPHTTATYRSMLYALERSGAQYLNPTARTITLGSLLVRVIPRPVEQSGQNNGSVGLLLEFGEFRALYTGDSERPELEGWVKAGVIPNVTVVKVAHHGARNGTTMNWIHATRPRVALISVGRNSYGHPAPEVENTWRQAGAMVYRTDMSGTIELRAARDGSVIVRTQAGATDTIATPLAAKAP
jgi:competence protein ComEC